MTELDPTQRTDAWKKPLDTVKYEPEDDAREFFKIETGITDNEELKQHILRVREKAYYVSLAPTSRV